MSFKKSHAMGLAALAIGLSGCSREAPNVSEVEPFGLRPRATVVPGSGWTIAVDEPSSPKYLWNPYVSSIDTLWVTIKDNTGTERFDASPSVGCEWTTYLLCSSVSKYHSSGAKSGILISVPYANKFGVVRAQLNLSTGASVYSGAVTYRMSAVATIQFTPSNPSVAWGATQQFASVAFDEWNNAVNGIFPRSYSSSNTSVGSIHSSGLFTAIGCGTTTVRAAFNDGFTNPNVQTTVTVLAPAGRACAASLLMQDNTVRNIYPGGHQTTAQTTLSYEVRDANGAVCSACANSVTFTSSNPSIVTVSSSGLLIAQSLGTATITGTIDGRTDQTVVQITAPPVILIDGPTVVRPNSQCTFTASISGGATPYSGYRWYDDETTMAGGVLSVVFTLDYAPSLNFRMTDADGKYVYKGLQFTYDANAPIDARCTY